MSAFGIFLVWYFGTMLISLPLVFQWISYLLKEHRRKEIGRQSSSTKNAIRAEVKIGPPLEFSAGADDLTLTEKGMSVAKELEIPVKKEWLTREELTKSAKNAAAFEKQTDPSGFSVAGRGTSKIGSENSPLWMQPPTPEHNRAIMPRGMGGSSFLRSRDIDPLVEKAIDLHRTLPWMGNDLEKKDKNDK
jgi:hypothetical protein